MRYNKILALTAAALLKATIAQAQDNWMVLRAGYNQRTETSATQIEAKAKLLHNFGLYGVFYSNPKDENKKGEHIPDYGELRATYRLDNIPKLPNGFGLATELNSGNEFSVFRFGISYEPELGNENHTLVKFFPVKSGANKETQFSFFTSQDISNRLVISALFDYNVKNGPNTFYFESEIDINYLLRRAALFFQVRSTRTIDDTITYPFAGIKVDLK